MLAGMKGLESSVLASADTCAWYSRLGTADACDAGLKAGSGMLCARGGAS